MLNYDSFSPQLIKTVLNMTALLDEKCSISQLFCLLQIPRLVISMHAQIFSCLQTKQQPHVSAYLKFPIFSLLFIFPFSSCPLGIAQHYLEACWRATLQDESLFGQKIHIATPNKNNSSLLM